MKPSLKWVGHSEDITTASTNFAVKSSWSTPNQYSQVGFQELSSVGPEILSAHALKAGLQGSLCKDSKAQYEIKPKT